MIKTTNYDKNAFRKENNKMTIMVLYHSPEQTDLHVYYFSFTQGHCFKFLA